MTSPYDCPSCGSSDTRKASVVYEQGTATTRGTIAGVGVGSSGVGVGVGRTKGDSSTISADINKPPEPNAAPGCAGMLAMIVTIIVAAWAGVNFFLTILLAFVATIVAAIWVFIYTRQGDAEARSVYDRRWYCLRCGTQFPIQ